MILNGLLWKPAEIVLLFMRLHPSTAFQTLVDYDGYSISSKGFLLTVKTDYNYGILRMEKVCVLVGVEGDGI